jgi:hypothetical protein
MLPQSTVRTVPLILMLRGSCWQQRHRREQKRAGLQPPNQHTRGENMQRRGVDVLRECVVLKTYHLDW